MHTRRSVPLVVLSAVLSAIAFAPVGKSAPPVKSEALDGKVVPLAALLEKAGAKLDPEAAPHWLAFVTEDGKVYPLVKDAGSRLFFNDKAVQDRKMRVTGRVLPDTRLLQVLSVNSYVKGELNDIYYWCEICSIRRNEKMTQCECCGGPTELREVPLKK